MPRKSMFDEKKEFIAKRLADGRTVKEILDELGDDWYCYDSLYCYIRKNFGKITKKRMECSRCENLIYLTSPYKKRTVPACPKQKREFRRDLKDCPFECKFMKERVTGEDDESNIAEWNG